MGAVRNLFVKLVKQDSGAEKIEYALILGLLLVLVIGAANATGVKILDRWNSISGAFAAADTSTQTSQSSGNSGSSGNSNSQGNNNGNSNGNNGNGNGNNGNNGNGNNGNNGNGNNGNNGNGYGH